MRMIRTIAILALTCTPLLAAAPAPKSKPGTDPKKKDEAPVVFTNKSLDDLPPPAPPTSLPDVVVAPGASADGDGPVGLDRGERQGRDSGAKNQ